MRSWKALALLIIILITITIFNCDAQDGVVEADDLFKKHNGIVDQSTIVNDLYIEDLGLTEIPEIRITNSKIVGKIIFTNAILPKKIKIINCDFFGITDFRGTLFNQSADFSSSRFHKSADFSGCQFKQSANFKSSKFYFQANFIESQFNESYYQESQFNESNFMGSTFNQSANFIGSHFNKVVRFCRSQFYQSAFFNNSHFIQDAYLQGSQFNQSAHFNGALFDQSALFQDSHFKRSADFSDSQFHQSGYFINTQFNQLAKFIGAGFHQFAYFRNSKFNQSAYFSNTHFNKLADFREAQFNQSADFRNTQFNQSTDFSDSFFRQSADFSDSQFQKDIIFKRSHQGALNFSQSKFVGDADFESIWTGNLNLSRTEFGKIFVRWESIDHLAYDETAYLLLMGNFKNLNFLEDANECYYDYRNERRSHLDWKYQPLDYILMEFYGYGVKPYSTIKWSIIFIALFAISFWVAQGILPKIDGKPSEKSGPVSPLDALAFSIMTFLSGGKLVFDPPKYKTAPGKSELNVNISKALYILERLLGMVLIIMFAIAVGKTIVLGGS